MSGKPLGFTPHLLPAPKAPSIAEHMGTPTSLRELVREAEQKTPQLSAALHHPHFDLGGMEVYKLLNLMCISEGDWTF